MENSEELGSRRELTITNMTSVVPRLDFGLQTWDVFVVLSPSPSLLAVLFSIPQIWGLCSHGVTSSNGAC